MNDSLKPEKTAVLLVEDHPLTQYGLEFIAFLERFCKTAGLAAPAILVCSVFEDRSA
ncbi:MAG: hypothetical protein LBH35_00155 [Treponema sp.]|jgi:hypothetical protein|nr:hypothetical protein [Treponema sp.]